jgi:chemotaxis response regulator CheB
MPNVPSLAITTTPNGAPETTSAVSGKNIREILADAFTFVKSMESNQALAAVTIEELMGDQIKRNGESAKANTSQYNPYEYDPTKAQPASQIPTEVANFLGGSDTGGPTKLDRVLAIKNILTALVTEIKKTEPLEVAGAQEYADQVLDQLPEEA